MDRAPKRSISNTRIFRWLKSTVHLPNYLFTYYYENQDQVDEQILHGLEESDRLAERVSDPDFRHKLADLKRRF